MKVTKKFKGCYELEKEGLKVEVQKDECEPQLDWMMYLNNEYVETFITLKEAKEWFKNVNVAEYLADRI